MSRSFESVRWDASVHKLDLGLYSHPKEFLGDGVRTHVNSKGKIPSTGGKNLPQRRIEPTTLHRAGQRARHTTNELFRPLDWTRSPRRYRAADRGKARARVDSTQ